MVGAARSGQCAESVAHQPIPGIFVAKPHVECEANECSMTEVPKKPFKLPIWLDPAGEPVSCLEKIKVLNENLEEIRELCQDALEDAVLMGCDETQFRAVLDRMTGSLVNPYLKKPDPKPDPKKDVS